MQTFLFNKAMVREMFTVLPNDKKKKDSKKKKMNKEIAIDESPQESNQASSIY